MKIQYISDLHLEFPDNRQYIKDNPIKPVAPYLIIAGDLGYLNPRRKHHIYDKYCDAFLEYCSKNWEQTIIIPGNHEYYGGYPLKSFNSYHKYNICDNVTLINNGEILLHGEDYNVKIFGSTLWSNINPLEYYDVSKTMNDYRYIKYSKNMMFNPGLSINEFLNTYSMLNQLSGKKQRMDKGLVYIDPKTSSVGYKPTKLIIVTHHGCHPECISECYRCSKINSAYFTDLSDIIKSKEPEAWIYGHTHQTVSFNIDDTKIRANSLGYVRYDDISHFNHEAVIEV